MNRIRILLAVLALVFSFCAEDNSINPHVPEPDPVIGSTIPGSPDQYRQEAIPFSINGTTIHLITHTCKCDSTSPEWTTTINLKPIPFKFIGDTLLIYTVSDDTVTIPQVKAQFYKSYVRMTACVGDCPSVYGVWERVGEGFTTSIPVGPTDYQKAAQVLAMDSDGYNYIRFTTYDITIYHLLDSLQPFTTHFMYDWNKYYASRVEVTVDSSQSDGVTLVGGVTGDTVRIFQDSAKHIISTSSYLGNQRYEYDPLSTNCPNPYYPAWYEQSFLLSNAKSDKAAFVILEPKAGDTLYCGDTIAVKLGFNALFAENNIGLMSLLSVDAGLEYHTVNCVQTGMPQFRTDRSYSKMPLIVIPDSLSQSNPKDPKIPTMSPNASLVVESYSNRNLNVRCDDLVILPRSQKPIK